MKLAHHFSPTRHRSTVNNNEVGQHNLQIGALLSKLNAWGLELEPSEDRNQANEAAATCTSHVLIVASHSTSLSSRTSQRISQASMAAEGYLPAAAPRQRGYIFDTCDGSSTTKVHAPTPSHVRYQAPAPTRGHMLTSPAALRAQEVAPYLRVINASAPCARAASRDMDRQLPVSPPWRWRPTHT